MKLIVGEDVYVVTEKRVCYSVECSLKNECDGYYYRTGIINICGYGTVEID
jgi:hypothetical protein